MDDPAYPLAMADRAFAYDGSFRTPDAMSAANRAAYGLHRISASNASHAFCTAMHRAFANTTSNANIAARGKALAVVDLSSRPARQIRTGVPQRDADLNARSAKTPARTLEPVRRSSIPYVLFVSAAGCTIRAMVWRGRVYCEGVRRCPISSR
jgi:hypothetical protein